MNLLTIDTETAPNQVDTWGLYNQNVSINQIRKPGHLLCWAAKWHGRPTDEVIFDSINESPRRRMVKHLHALLNDADAVIGYNSKKFDTKVINTEFVLQGLPPVAPFKHIDLLLASRANFRFASNKLDYVSQQLKLGTKTAHQGHGLWTACEQGDQDAWALMKKYNMQDVLLTERLYDRLLPWIKGHPNLNNYNGTGHRCPHCGSAKLQRRGISLTAGQQYARYQCFGVLPTGLRCGAWSQDAFKLNDKARRGQITRAAS